MPTILRQDVYNLQPPPSVPQIPGYPIAPTLGSVGNAVPQQPVKPVDPNGVLVDQMKQQKSEIDEYIERLNKPDAIEELERSRSITAQAPALQGVIGQHVLAYRERLAALETASRKFDNEKRGLDLDRVQVNKKMAQIAAATLECGTKERDCVRMQRENVEWREKVKAKDGNARLIRVLSEEVDIWRAKIAAFEKSVLKYEAEKKMVANMQASMAKIENDLKVAHAAQRRADTEVKLLEAENDKLRALQTPYTPPLPVASTPEPAPLPPPPQPVAAKADVERKIKDLLESRPIQFVQSEATITEDGRMNLNVIAEELNRLPLGTTVELHGHTFCKPPCVNKCGLVELSQRRCNSIVTELNSAGLNDKFNFNITAWGCKEPTIGSQKIVRFLIP